MPLILKILHGNEDQENVTSLISIFYGFLSSAHSPHDRFSMTRSPAFSDGSTFVSSKLTPGHRPARHGCKHGTVTTFHPKFFTHVRRRKHLQPPGPNLSFLHPKKRRPRRRRMQFIKQLPSADAGYGGQVAPPFYRGGNENPGGVMGQSS